MTNSEKAAAFKVAQQAGFDLMMAKKKAERDFRDQLLINAFKEFLAEQEAWILEKGEAKPLHLTAAGMPPMPKPSTPQSLKDIMAAVLGAAIDATGTTPTSEADAPADLPSEEDLKEQLNSLKPDNNDEADAN